MMDVAFILTEQVLNYSNWIKWFLLTIITKAFIFILLDIKMEQMDNKHTHHV